MTEWPRITVVTPSFNQAKFLERTIQSVLDQQYPNLEYIIIDGGSSDGSVDIIRKYSKHLAYWVSESDAGQSHALNKGLKRATGAWVGWQNSDDTYCPGAFFGLAKAAERHPDAGLIVADMMLVDEGGAPLRDIRYVKPTYRSLLAEGMVLTNQSAFWKSGCHDLVGYLDESLHYAFDYEWFLRLTEHVEATHVGQIWGTLRLHGETKTSLQSARFGEENARILKGRAMSSWEKRLFRARRLCLMLADMKFGYVLRGIIRRASGKAGELY